MPARRSAFAMVELLLLAGMATTVTLLGVVAVERSRETANRLACAANLKALGLAAHAYTDAHQSLPPGWWGSIPVDAGANGGSTGPGNGPLPQLLPFLKAESLFKQVDGTIVWDPKRAVADLWPTLKNDTAYNLKALQVAATPIKVLQCPADFNTSVAAPDEVGAGGKRLQPEYVVASSVFTFANGGRKGDPATSNTPDAASINWGHSSPGEWSGYFVTRSFDDKIAAYNPFGRVNYLPVAGLGQGKSAFYTQFEGVFTDRSATTLAAVAAADGTSRTLMFGETCGQFYPAYGENTMQENLFAAVGMPTHRGLQQRCAPGIGVGRPVTDCDGVNFAPGEGQKARFGTFSSAHLGGVQFCFCDGSVRVIARSQTWRLGSPDWYVFQQLAGFHDGFHRDTHDLVR